MTRRRPPHPTAAAIRGVLVDSGPPAPEMPNRETPREEWPELVRLRRGFLEVNMLHDCRCLAMFVRETDEMWQPLGYASKVAMLSEGYGLDLEKVQIAVRWLELSDSDYPHDIAEGESPMPLELLRSAWARASREEQRTFAAESNLPEYGEPVTPEGRNGGGS